MNGGGKETPPQQKRHGQTKSGKRRTAERPRSMKRGRQQKRHQKKKKPTRVSPAKREKRTYNRTNKKLSKREYAFTAEFTSL